MSIVDTKSINNLTTVIDYFVLWDLIPVHKHSLSSQRASERI